MLKILCPTDFSEHSKYSIEFAFNIGKALNAEIKLITVYHERRTASSFKSVKRYIQEANEKELKKLKNELVSVFDYTNPVSCIVLEGFVNDAILRYAEAKKIDLIIMGTQGNKTRSNRLFGSVASSLIKHTKIPVLAIPSDIKYYPAEQGHVLLPLDSQDIKHQLGFELLRIICEKLDKKIKILHIENDDENKPFEIPSSVENVLGEFISETVLSNDNDIASFIDFYIENNQVEMLVMIRRKHSFLERILLKSHTDLELANTQIPFLIIPGE